MALSSSSRSDPWDHFLHSRSIPGVPGTPWSGGAGRQVQGWQAATALGSARRQFGPLLPCPTDGSPEAGSRPPHELLLHSFRRSQGEPAPLFLRALPVFSLSAHLRSWCLRSLGPSPLRPLRPREAGAWVDPGHFCIASACFAFSCKPGRPLGTAERRGALTVSLRVPRLRLTHGHSVGPGLFTAPLRLRDRRS